MQSGHRLQTQKIVIVGDLNSGKSQLFSVLTSQNYNERILPTQGAMFNTRTFIQKDLLENYVKFQIWDTTGAARFETITATYYPGSYAALVCCDLTCNISLEDLNRRIRNIKGISPNTKIILVGTKSDVAIESNVRDLEKYAKDHEYDCYMVSAKTGENVESMFEKIGENFKSIKGNVLIKDHNIAEEKIILNRIHKSLNELTLVDPSGDVVDVKTKGELKDRFQRVKDELSTLTNTLGEKALSPSIEKEIKQLDIVVNHFCGVVNQYRVVQQDINEYKNIVNQYPSNNLQAIKEKRKQAEKNQKQLAKQLIAFERSLMPRWLRVIDAVASFTAAMIFAVGSALGMLTVVGTGGIGGFLLNMPGGLISIVGGSAIVGLWAGQLTHHLIHVGFHRYKMRENNPNKEFYQQSLFFTRAMSKYHQQSRKRLNQIERNKEDLNADLGFLHRMTR